jgi:hypothetical protein
MPCSFPEPGGTWTVRGARPGPGKWPVRRQRNVLSAGHLFFIEDLQIGVETVSGKARAVK